jgi:hypothetical protein
MMSDSAPPPPDADKRTREEPGQRPWHTTIHNTFQPKWCIFAGFATPARCFAPSLPGFSLTDPSTNGQNLRGTNLFRPRNDFFAGCLFFLPPPHPKRPKRQVFRQAAIAEGSPPWQSNVRLKFDQRNQRFWEWFALLRFRPPFSAPSTCVFKSGYILMCAFSAVIFAIDRNGHFRAPRLRNLFPQNQTWRLQYLVLVPSLPPRPPSVWARHRGGEGVGGGGGGGGSIGSASPPSGNGSVEVCRRPLLKG